VLKINFDAAVWNGNQAIVACVVRNNAGELKLVASFTCEYESVYDAELRGGWEAF